MDIRAGTLTARYLFDVAEHIDVPVLRRLLGGGVPARLPSKSTAPAYLRYQTPPLVVDGDAIGAGEVAGFRSRLRFFDYGVVSLAVSRDFTGSWASLVDESQRYIENAALEGQAEQTVREVIGRCGSAITRSRESYLAEDYLVVALHHRGSRVSRTN